MLPWTSGGHQFVVFGDCCSGIPGTDSERHFRAVNTARRYLRPRPAFICFLGDHVAGLIPDIDRLRAQWSYFLKVENRAVQDEIADVYHLTSNHNTYGADSIAVWRTQFPSPPRNGPKGEEGLAYCIRRGNLLLVMLNTASLARGGDAGLSDAASDWLNAVLETQADASHKLVFGHHPMHPVNGYREYPKWCVPPHEAERVWDTLVRHGVQAYVCRHIIAFDVQVHRGLPQITSGGAGTVYGPGGAMPCLPEYQHFLRLAVDDFGLRLQTRDPAWRLREWLTWSPAETAACRAAAIVDGAVHDIASPVGWCGDANASHTLTWRFIGLRQTAATSPPQSSLMSAEAADGRHVFEIGIEANRLLVCPHNASGDARLTMCWRGPPVPDPSDIDLDVAIHTGMGPGGML